MGQLSLVRFLPLGVHPTPAPEFVFPTLGEGGGMLGSEARNNVCVPKVGLCCPFGRFHFSCEQNFSEVWVRRPGGLASYPIPQG